MHYFHSYLNQFPENPGSYSKEQRQRFHQDQKTMVDRYQGRWDQHMMDDYCWWMQRDYLTISHSRKSQKESFYVYNNIINATFDGNIVFVVQIKI